MNMNTNTTARYTYMHKTHEEPGKPLHRVCMERTKAVLMAYARSLGLNLDVLYTPEELLSRPGMERHNPDDRFIRVTFEEVTREEVELESKNVK